MSRSFGFNTFGDTPPEPPRDRAADPVAPEDSGMALPVSALPPFTGTPSRLSAVSTLVVIGYAALLLLPALDGSFRVLTQHEVFAAQTAREMLQAGDWIIPHFAGVPRLNKPPGMYWLIAGFMTVFQSHAEWVVRLPSALAGMLTAVLIAQLAARWLGNFTGMIAGLMQASLFYVVMQSRLAEADMPMCAAVTLAMTAFARAMVFRPGSSLEPRRTAGLAALFGTGVGASVLLKGVGIAFIPAGCLLWMLLTRRWRGLRFMFHPASLLPLVVLAGAWPLAAWLRDPRILDVWYFETFERAGGAFGDDDPWHIYFWAVPMLLLPWLPFAVRGLVHWIKVDRTATAAIAASSGTAGFASPATVASPTPVSERSEDPDSSADAAAQQVRRESVSRRIPRPTVADRLGWSIHVAFLLSWFAGGMVLLLFSQARHKHYAIPMLPPITLLAALGFVNWLQDPRRLSVRKAVIAAVAIAVAAIGGAVVARYTMPKAAVATAWIVASIGVCVAAAVWLHARRELRRTTLACFTAAAIGVVGAARGVIPAFDDYKASAELAMVANTFTPSDQPIYLVGVGQSQAAYYLHRPLKRIDKREADRIRVGFGSDPFPARYVLCNKSVVPLLESWGSPQILAEVDHLRRTETDPLVFVRVVRDVWSDNGPATQGTERQDAETPRK